MTVFIYRYMSIYIPHLRRRAHACNDPLQSRCFAALYDVYLKIYMDR